MADDPAGFLADVRRQAEDHHLVPGDDALRLVAFAEAAQALVAKWRRQSGNSYSAAAGCAGDLDHALARELGGDEQQTAGMATVAVFPPGCDSHACAHHYRPGRNLAAEGCVCLSWFDGDGWHLISVNPQCRAHDVPTTAGQIEVPKGGSADGR